MVEIVLVKRGLKMKAKLFFEGREVEVEVSDVELQKLIAAQYNVMRTGYERREGDIYYYDYNGIVESDKDENLEVDDSCYNAANYYSDKTVAENNARADKLMRELRRFSVEHRNTNKSIYRYSILYLKGVGLQLRKDSDLCFCGPWFNDEQTGVKAIEKFHDELIWYFTEYKDSSEWKENE